MKKRIAVIMLTAVSLLTACAKTEEVLSENSVAETIPVTSEQSQAADTLTFTAEYSRKRDAEYVIITTDTRFYECRYSQENVVTDEADFGDKNLLNKAQEFIDGSETAAGIIRTQFNDIDMLGDSEISYTFRSGITRDFDGDGSEESFLLFKAGIDGVDLNSIWKSGFLLFADSSGEITLLNETMNTDDRLYPADELYELQYSGFSHLVINGGHSNNTAIADYYSVNGSSAKLELREFSKYLIQDGFALCQTMAQATNAWLIFWNDEAKCYVTPEKMVFSESDTKAMAAMLPPDEDNEYIKQAELYGGKYYRFMPVGNSYIYSGGSFSKFYVHPFGTDSPVYPIGERQQPLGGEFDIPFAADFDYDAALAQMIRLD